LKFQCILWKNQYIAERISAKSKAESNRLTAIVQEKLDIQRASNFTSEIEKLNRNRFLKGDRMVFKTDKEFEKAGLEVLEKYNASDSERRWFLGLI